KFPVQRYLSELDAAGFGGSFGAFSIEAMSSDDRSAWTSWTRSNAPAQPVVNPSPTAPTLPAPQSAPSLPPTSELPQVPEPTETPLPLPGEPPATAPLPTAEPLPVAAAPARPVTPLLADEPLRLGSLPADARLPVPASLPAAAAGGADAPAGGPLRERADLDVELLLHPGPSAPAPARAAVPESFRTDELELAAAPPPPASAAFDADVLSRARATRLQPAFAARQMVAEAPAAAPRPSMAAAPLLDPAAVVRARLESPAQLPTVPERSVGPTLAGSVPPGTAAAGTSSPALAPPPPLATQASPHAADADVARVSAAFDAESIVPEAGGRIPTRAVADVEPTPPEATPVVRQTSDPKLAASVPAPAAAEPPAPADPAPAPDRHPVAPAPSPLPAEAPAATFDPEPELVRLATAVRPRPETASSPELPVAAAAVDAEPELVRLATAVRPRPETASSPELPLAAAAVDPEPELVRLATAALPRPETASSPELPVAAAAVDAEPEPVRVPASAEPQVALPDAAPPPADLRPTRTDRVLTSSASPAETVFEPAPERPADARGATAPPQPAAGRSPQQPSLDLPPGTTSEQAAPKLAQPALQTETVPVVEPEPGFATAKAARPPAAPVADLRRAAARRRIYADAADDRELRAGAACEPGGARRRADDEFAFHPARPAGRPRTGSGGVPAGDRTARGVA